MDYQLELYCALREIAVPAEKARAVVDALEAARKKKVSGSGVGHTPVLIGSDDLQDLKDELLELRLQRAADTVVIQVGGLIIGVAWLMLML